MPATKRITNTIRQNYGATFITQKECCITINESLAPKFHNKQGVYVLLVYSEYYDNQYDYLFKVGKCESQSFFQRLIAPSKKYCMTDFVVLMINPNCISGITEKNIKNEANSLGLNANLIYQDGSKCTEYYKVDKRFIDIVRKYGCYEAGELSAYNSYPAIEKIIPINNFMRIFFNDHRIFENYLNTAYNIKKNNNINNNIIIDLTHLD
jgi:hypothetical protein